MVTLSFPMLLALAIRTRRCLLMQLGSSTSLKRSFSQATSPNPGPMSSKLPRIAKSSDPPALVTPPFQIHRPNRPSALRSSQSGSSHRITGRSRKSTPRKSLPPPLHDSAYIQQQYRNSDLLLRHESAPKSSLGNFSMLSIGNLPSYHAEEGLFVDGSPIWR